MTITIDLDESAIKRKIESGVDRAQLALDIQVLKDSNYNIPRREDTLMRSGHIPEPGTVEWDAIYSRAQYYLYPNKSKDKNPNASMQWFEHAKARELKNWEKLANEEYNR